MIIYCKGNYLMCPLVVGQVYPPVVGQVYPPVVGQVYVCMYAKIAVVCNDCFGIIPINL